MLKGLGVQGCGVWGFRARGLGFWVLRFWVSGSRVQVFRDQGLPRP